MAEKTQRVSEAKIGEEPEARARQEARDKQTATATLGDPSDSKDCQKV